MDAAAAPAERMPKLLSLGGAKASIEQTIQVGRRSWPSRGRKCMGKRYVGNQHLNALASALAHGLNKAPGNGKIFVSSDNNAFRNQEGTLSHSRAVRTIINSPDDTHRITV